MRVASFNCSSIVTNLRVVPTVSHRKVQNNSMTTNTQKVGLNCYLSISDKYSR